MRSMRSDLGRVRGLGSAKEGTDHWWHQRLTAIALVPLALWFVASVVGLVGAEQAAVQAWLANPLVAVAMVLLVAVTLWHAALGMQVVIEDYVHREGCKLAAIIAVKFLAAILAAIAVFAVLKIAFGG